MGPDTPKTQWREAMRARRREVGPDVAAAVVDGLADHLTGEPGLILFYRALPYEVPLEALADRLGWTRFVVTRTPADGPLTLHPAIGAMERHAYGFAQPVEGAMELPPHHVSVALVPGLAFDRAGTRLGHGAGYYDELLAAVPGDRPRIGVTLDELVVDELPHEPHDVAMTHLATESGVVPCR